LNKLFNYRPLLFSVIFLATGIFTGFVRLKYGLTALFIFGLAAVYVLSSFTLRLIPIKINGTKSFKIQNAFLFLYKQRFFALIMVVVFATGFFLFTLSLNFFRAHEINDGVQAYVSGEIEDCYYTENGGYVILENARVWADNGYSYKGRVYVYISGGDALPDKGNMEFTGKISANKLYSGGKINTYYIRNGLPYSFFIDNDEYILKSGSPSIFLTINKYVKNVLYSHMEEQNAAMCYALINGNSLLIDGDLKEAFRESGIAHIFAVSGLHIGVLSASVIYILNRLKIKKFFQLLIMAALMLFYAAVCNFTPSVIRAALMTLIYLLSKACGVKYDILSSLSLAALVILVLSPLMLFDAGFLLSFFSVLGIIFLYPSIIKLFKFLPKAIASLLSLSISVQFFIIPLTVCFFGYFAPASLILNLLVIPLISIAYISLFALLVLSFLPYITYMLFVPQGICHIIRIAMAVLDIKAVYINGSEVGALFYYVMLLTLSGFIFLKPKIKAIFCAVLLALFSFSSFYVNSPLKYNVFSFSSVNISKYKASIITCGGKYYYVDYGSKTLNLDELKAYLGYCGIYRIEAAFFTDYNTAVRLTEEFNGFYVNKFIFPFGYEYPRLTAPFEAENKVKYLLSREIYTYESLGFSAYYFNGKNYGGIITADGFSILYLSAEDNETYQYIDENTDLNFNAVFCDKDYNYVRKKYGPAVIVTTRYMFNQSFDIFSSSLDGNLIFNVKNDKIYKAYNYR
jgi:competence protein ComEC